MAAPVTATPLARATDIPTVTSILTPHMATIVITPTTTDAVNESALDPGGRSPKALLRDTLGIVTIARCKHFFQPFPCEYSRFIRVLDEGGLVWESDWF
jgi:hypothetical protein